MIVNYTARDEMVQIFSNNESKDKCSRMGRRLFKLVGQAGGGVYFDSFALASQRLSVLI